MSQLQSYIRPKSLTWWMGVLSVAIGIAQVATPGLPGWAGELGKLVALLTGGVVGQDPVQYMLIGLGLIGIRAKLERIGAGA